MFFGIKKFIIASILVFIYSLPLLANLYLQTSDFEREYPAQNQKNVAAINNAQIFPEKTSAVILAQKLDQLIETSVDTQIYDQNRLTECKALIFQALQALPKSHARQLKQLTFMFDTSLRRGYGGQTSIRLRCTDISDEELVAVFRHEIGHLVDTGLKKGSFFSGASDFRDGGIAIYNDDPSISFYRISWLNQNIIKDKNSLNFISGYANTDPFEDFAESYNAYISQGSRFRTYAKNNSTLARKYYILKKHFFANLEYGLTEEPANNYHPLVRSYDTTTLSYNLEKSFLATN